VYRDQGNAGRDGDGKELCDLLIVFGDDVVLFSDKASAYPSTGDDGLDWRRWYGRTIRSAAKQLKGAERWIRQFPDRLFIDRACNVRLPIAVSETSRLRVHRVIVAHGSVNRCKARLGGSGSLIIRPGIREAIRPTSADRGEEPFTLGIPPEAGGFVHVLDDTTLPRLLRTLDTVADFIAYLRRKEAFINSGRLGMAAGEEELLGVYLKDVNADDEHDFVIPGDELILLPEGHWEKFVSSPEHAAQVEADRVSYVWDHLIEELTSTLFQDTAYDPSVVGIANTEPLLRRLAKENRTQRRFLGESLLEVARRADSQVRAARTFLSRENPSQAYVFIALDPAATDTPELYREVRRMLMHAYSLVARRQNPELREVVAVGTESAKESLRSFDAAFLDVAEWTAEQEEQARLLEDKGEVMKAAARVEWTGAEYPVTSGVRPSAGGPSRNKPCPCGSGRNYKNCHGR
jgi:hypothetical protein